MAILPHNILERTSPVTAITADHRSEQSRGGQLIIVGAVLEVFAILSVILRIYVRVRLVRIIALDDAAIILGMLCISAVTGLYIWAVTAGLGKFLNQIPTDAIPQLLKALNLAQILYHPSLLFIKASIIFFILRLTPFPGYRKLLWTTLVFTAVYLMGAMAFSCFQCNNLDRMLHRESRRCINQQIVMVIGYVTSGVNIFTDIMLVIFPIPLLWNAPIPQRKKVIVRVVLAFGLFVTAAASVRLLYVVLDHKNLNISKNIDYIIWTIVELHVGVIVVNIPAYAPLVKSFLEQQRKRSNASLIRQTDGEAIAKQKSFRLKVVHKNRHGATLNVNVDVRRPQTNKSSDGFGGKFDWGRQSPDGKDSSIFLADAEGSRVAIFMDNDTPLSPRTRVDTITEIPPAHTRDMRTQYSIYAPSSLSVCASSEVWPLPPTPSRPLPLQGGPFFGPHPPRERKNSNFSMEESTFDFHA